MSINSLHVDNTEEDICCICHDTLSAHQTYTLPECKHSFHTHCIVTWFRHTGSSEPPTLGGQSGITDGKCPLCGNRGINNKTIPKTKRFYGIYFTAIDQEKFTRNKKYIKGEDASKELKALYKKLQDTQQKYNLFLDKQREFKKSIKEKDVDYEETNKIMHKFRKDKWSNLRQLNAVKKTISNLPIIPLIIPTPIDIN
jgi:hypothetical protein